ncbi:MAG TPA: hypothetical protein VK752_06440 [Bryobacteraceae bacterium]|jgi:hypothetical protein|nr:hypothetical protein [Bryobacteraceae bacterium]
MSSSAPEVNNLPLVNVTAATASEICARLYLDKAALGLLRPAMSPRGFVDALVEAKLYLAAIDFLAHALPSREAIWWGCLSLQRTCGNKLEPWERRAFRITVQWVLQPDEANREAAKQPAEVLGPASAAGNLAAAANQTGGSIGPPQGPPIPPSPFAPARAVAIAIKLASTKCEATEIQSTQRSLIGLGMAIAEGRFAPKGLPS